MKTLFTLITCLALSLPTAFAKHTIKQEGAKFVVYDNGKFVGFSRTKAGAKKIKKKSKKANKKKNSGVHGNDGEGPNSPILH